MKDYEDNIVILVILFIVIIYLNSEDDPSEYGDYIIRNTDNRSTESIITESKNKLEESTNSVVIKTDKEIEKSKIWCDRTFLAISSLQHPSYRGNDEYIDTRLHMHKIRNNLYRIHMDNYSVDNVQDHIYEIKARHFPWIFSSALTGLSYMDSSFNSDLLELMVYFIEVDILKGENYEQIQDTYHSMFPILYSEIKS